MLSTLRRFELGSGVSETEMDELDELDDDESEREHCGEFE